MGTKTKIDWADATWNPVTGCLHGCEYCFARKIAQRFGMAYAPKLGDPGMEGACKYDSPEGMDTMLELMKPYQSREYKKMGKIEPYPMGFLPTFHRYRLGDPARMKNPQDIFVVDMGDLFGDWVPDAWIQKVFAACQRAPWHRYLFLTKNPKRYEELEAVRGLPWADNYWFGTSCTKPGDGYTWFNEKKFHWFLSVEPLHGPVSFTDQQHMPEWVIVGAETGNRRGKVVPERDWVMHIKEQCREAGVPVFMKESLRELMGPDFVQAYPWAVERE